MAKDIGAQIKTEGGKLIVEVPQRIEIIQRLLQLMV